MTDRIAVFLALVILALLAVDAVFFDWAYSLQLAIRFSHLLEWLAFWR